MILKVFFNLNDAMINKAGKPANLFLTYRVKACFNRPVVTVYRNITIYLFFNLIDWYGAKLVVGLGNLEGLSQPK